MYVVMFSFEGIHVGYGIIDRSIIVLLKNVEDKQVGKAFSGLNMNFIFGFIVGPHVGSRVYGFNIIFTNIKEKAKHVGMYF